MIVNRVAKAVLSAEDIMRMQDGETVTVRLPEGVTELQVSIHDERRERIRRTARKVDEVQTKIETSMDNVWGLVDDLFGLFSTDKRKGKK